MSYENPAECFRQGNDCALADQVYTIGYTDNVRLSPDSIRGSLTGQYVQTLDGDTLRHRLSMVLLEAGRWDEYLWGGYPSYDGGHNMVVPVGKNITAVYDFPYEPNELEPYLVAVMLKTKKGLCVAQFNEEYDGEDSFSTVSVANARGVTIAETSPDEWATLNELGLHNVFYKTVAALIVDWLKHREDKQKYTTRTPFSDVKTEALYRSIIRGEIDIPVPGN